MALSTCTITGHWVSPSNHPAKGHITIQAVVPAAGGGYIVAGDPVHVPLVDGAINKVVVSNAEATTLQYRITEAIDGAVPVSYVVNPSGSSLDLSTAPRSTEEVGTFVLASAVGAPNGVAPLDANGKVPQANLPTEAAVTSVDGRTGAVTLTDRYDAAGTATNTMEAHLAAADPHPQYQTQAESDARYVQPSALAPVATTGAYSDLTGQPTIPSTPAEVGADPAGTAASSMSTHLAAADPHPQYLTQAEGDGRYVQPATLDGYATDGELAAGLATKADLADLAAVATSGAYSDLTGKPTIPTTPGEVGADPAGAASSAVAAHVGASDPHTQYHNDTRGDARYYTKTQIDADTPRVIRFSGSWPARGNSTRPAFFIGGSAATNAPSDINLAVGDLWFPATA